MSDPSKTPRHRNPSKSSRCAAKTSAGVPCKRFAIAGASVCPAHGGKAPQVRAKAAEVVLEQRARALLPAQFVEHSDPLGEALRTLSEAVAFRDALRELVGEVSKIRYSDDKGAEQLRSEIAVYERALDRVGKMCADLIRLDIESRLVRVAEVQAAAIVTVIREVCAAHNVPEVVVSVIGERIGAMR